MFLNGRGSNPALSILVGLIAPHAAEARSSAKSFA
jgi:hypothetical protein